MPANGKRELQPGWVDDFSSAFAAKEFSFQKILFSATPGRDGFRRASGLVFVRPQALKDIDGGGKRRTHRAVLSLAIPTTVMELFAEQAVYEGVHVQAEVDAQSDCPAVDAWFHFAVEERLACVLPPTVLLDSFYGIWNSHRVWFQSKIEQELKGGKSGSPRLPVVVVSRLPTICRETCASRPLAVGSLQAEQPGSPALCLYPGALGGDYLIGRMEKVTQDLPSNGGIRIEEPVECRHRMQSSSRKECLDEWWGDQQGNCMNAEF